MAANHLENPELKNRVDEQSRMLNSLSEGILSNAAFIDSFEAHFPKLEKLAGQRVDPSTALLDLANLGLGVEKAESIKAGRSSDLIVSEAILADTRTYLAQEIMGEGISSMLAIDNAGRLIVNVGNKPSLDMT
jgi:hypothetical protein